MTQVPLAPPTPTGGPIDGWLYLLWKRVTAAGQILWSSITPSTSADVAAVVTDETGTAGSLVFSGNPTLQGVTNSGNLVFTGTGTRIIGDFSNATFSNRVMWQTSTADSSTTLGIIPNGTGPNGTLNLYNNSDPTNAGRLVLTCGTGEAAIYSTIHGSGTYVPLGVYVNNVETARFALNGVNTFGGVSTAPALKVTPVASQARWIEVTGATSGANPTLGVSGGILAISASVAITGVVSTSGYTVATLPVGAVGQRAYVTDALAPAYGVAVAGGGAVTIPVFYNGAAWICA